MPTNGGKRRGHDGTMATGGIVHTDAADVCADHSRAHVPPPMVDRCVVLYHLMQMLWHHALPPHTRVLHRVRCRKQGPSRHTW